MWGLRPDQIQTSLCSHRKQVEILVVCMETRGILPFSLNIFNCLFNNGVGLQVLTTLVTVRPLFVVILPFKQ